MSNPNFTEFELLLIRSNNEVGTAVLLILAWVAASDGSIDENEEKKLSEISAASKHGHEIKPLLHLVQNRDIKSLQLSSEIIAKHFRGEKAPLFIEMAIGMAIADGYLLPTENYILRFLADLLGINRARLNEIFVQVTSQKFPDPSDVSSAYYWNNREKTKKRTDREDDDKNKSQATKNEKLENSYAILGLKYGASKEEIKKAFRRLAQVHHPDRFSSLGKESVAAATITFQRISEAYKYLVNYA